MKKINNQQLLIILFLGAVIRLGFILYGAEIFFQRENIHYDSDTGLWKECISNLINHGNYIYGSKGWFCRMPGYSFFMGGVYFISGRDWINTYKVIGWIQTSLDTISIFIIYKISQLYFNNTVALLSALIYSLYPFIIVWNPVAYSESISIFLLLITILFFLKFDDYKFKYLGLSSFFLSLSCLTRPQLLVLFPILGFVLIMRPYFSRTHFFKKLLWFSFIFLFIFGLWPARNFINHNKFIITKNVEGVDGFTEDVVSFMQYVYAVKTDWDPQFSSIVKNKKTIFPDICYKNKADSLKLESVIYLAKTCGSGFSRKEGYWAQKITAEKSNCDSKIADIFNSLRKNLIKENKLNFYLIVPLNNLKKAIFKYNPLNNLNDSLIKKIMFLYRALLILLGTIGLFSLYKKQMPLFTIIFLTFILIYGVLCFGTSPFMRNIEIRYFLQADILLIIPAANFIYNSYLFFKNKRINQV